MLKRNDKCYCGSGKKYKNCCMDKDKVDKVEILNNKALDSKKEKIDKKYTESIVKLSGYLEELIRKDDKIRKHQEEAKETFFDENTKDDEAAARFFASYFSYDYVIGKDMTPAIYILNKKKFNSTEKRIISNCVNSYPSLFEIDSVDGREVTIKDLFTGKKYNTLDSKILGEFTKGDYLIARPVLIDDTYILIDLTIRIQAETKDVIYNSIMEAYESSKPNQVSMEYFVMINTLFFYKYIVQLLQMSDYVESEDDDQESKESSKEESAENIEETQTEELAENTEETKAKEETVEETQPANEVSNSEEDEMTKILKEKIEDASVLEAVIKLWKDVAGKTEITGSENGWASGLEYHYRKSIGESVTQTAIAKNYGVSASTLAKRNKEITSLVSISE